MGQRPLHPAGPQRDAARRPARALAEDLGLMAQTGFDANESCPMCTTFRVRSVPWNVRSGARDEPATGVTVWECFGCGHVWRKPTAPAALREARVA